MERNQDRLLFNWHSLISRYANCDENSSAEGAVGYGGQPSTSSSATSSSHQQPENIYETICGEPGASNEEARHEENIYETIEDVRVQKAAQQQQQGPVPSTSQQSAEDEQQSVYDLDPDQPSCSSTYGRIGNAYGR